MNTSVALLNKEFGVDGEVTFRDAGDGFIIIDIDNSHCSASIAMQGAHLMSWTPKGEKPVIWMSPAATFTAGKSIRGGVPICWPWFGAHATQNTFPSHGFARTSQWQVTATDQLEDGCTRISFSMVDGNSQLWPLNTPVAVDMVIGHYLEIGLTTENLEDESITLGSALHTYFTVSDASKITIHGLDGCDYLDTVGSITRKKQQGDITIAEEVDRIYFDQGQDIVIEDPVLGREIRIEKQGSHSTIVWNPWIDKTLRMGDFGSDDGYLDMVCVESANASEDIIELAAGDSHTLWVRYTLE